MKQLIYLRLDSLNNVTRCCQKILSTLINHEYFKTCCLESKMLNDLLLDLELQTHLKDYSKGQLSEYKPIKERYYMVMNLDELVPDKFHLLIP